MQQYQKPNSSIWVGRKSAQQLYLHEKVTLVDLNKDDYPKHAIALLGYACDEGVRRNQGRVGAKDGPDAIRKAFAKLPNHLPTETKLVDLGTVTCTDGNMEETQHELAIKVSKLLHYNNFPMLFGGGHDIAYAHYNGIKNHFGNDKAIGIINFDAHFDLRANTKGNNSGTPFFQIAQECTASESSFQYLALGIRSDANDNALFKTASELGVTYIDNANFKIHQLSQIQKQVLQFIAGVDLIYVTIDLDGFSSAFAPGVSAASPMGFSPTIVLEILSTIISTKKLVSLDFAEMNPHFDRDNQTAKLAASLAQFVINLR